MGFAALARARLYLGERNKAGAHLSDRGWRVSRRGIDGRLAEDNQSPLARDEDGGTLGELQYVTAILGT